jgi:hypothetical protein
VQTAARFFSKALDRMRSLFHSFTFVLCLLASGAVASAQIKFELRAPYLPPRPPLIVPSATPTPIVKSPADGNVIDLTRTIQASPLGARGIVGRMDEKQAISFEPRNLRSINERNGFGSSGIEQVGIAGLLGAALFGGWFFFPRRKVRRRRGHRARRDATLPPPRKRFSY